MSENHKFLNTDLVYRKRKQLNKSKKVKQKIN